MLSSSFIPHATIIHQTFDPFARQIVLPINTLPWHLSSPRECFLFSVDIFFANVDQFCPNLIETPELRSTKKINCQTIEKKEPFFSQGSPRENTKVGPFS